jgi:hypothetical protein
MLRIRGPQPVRHGLQWLLDTEEAAESVSVTAVTCRWNATTAASPSVVSVPNCQSVPNIDVPMVSSRDRSPHLLHDSGHLLRNVALVIQGGPAGDQHPEADEPGVRITDGEDDP